MGDSRFDGILEAFDCALLEYVAGEEEGDCECDDCVLVVELVGEADVFVVVVVVVVIHVWGVLRCLPTVEEMATETWLWVRSILCGTDIEAMLVIRIQGKIIMYTETAEVP